MDEAYYPRHELDTAADAQADALQARVRLLEGLLREVASDYCADSRCNCPGYRKHLRIQQALEAGRGH